ncbi:MAG: LD-carboxypeptidase [Deltaproteobacteria bacterium]|nr:LD-carboxypeptidase [Deltaproteobacteria bacterium]
MLKRLSSDKKIGVVSVSSSMSPNVFKNGECYVRALGFDIVCPLDPCANWGKNEHGFGSATPPERADAFMQLIKDDDVGVVVLARGGYGAGQILPLLDYEEIARQKKLIVGFSDVTVLLSAIAKKSELITVHGPTLSTLGEAIDCMEAQESASLLFHLLQDNEYRPMMHGEIARPGHAEGRLIIGNLSLLTALIGTPWDLDYSGKILAIEDVNEPAYRIHRALMQMYYAGKLEHLAGLCLGQFSFSGGTSGKDIAQEELIVHILRDILSKTSYPVIVNCPFGHNENNVAWPFYSHVSIRNGEMIGIQQIIS